MKRHFRQLGINAGMTEITAAGIGDMSGDVFGNGMLLFPHLKLVGVLDHRHILLDPDPDPAAAARERERLFRLPGSSWGDYDEAILSPGGGVFPRSAKVIPLSPEARELLGTEDEAATPHEVIRALLRAPVDLLWNGAIGTFVKASTESNVDVGDKVNDRGEGQCRRAAVPRGGRGRQPRLHPGGPHRVRPGRWTREHGLHRQLGWGRLSDREVNIKILLDGEVADGDLTRKQRDALLAEMTDEVADLVLRDNYLQAQALARTLASTRQRGPRYLGLLRSVEQAGRVERGLDPGSEMSNQRLVSRRDAHGPRAGLPVRSHQDHGVRRTARLGRPGGRYLARAPAYFPTPLRERFAARMHAHPLRREIIASSVANEVVNRLDFTATFTVADYMGATLAESPAPSRSSARSWGCGGCGPTSRPWTVSSPWPSRPRWWTTSAGCSRRSCAGCCITAARRSTLKPR